MNEQESPSIHLVNLAEHTQHRHLALDFDQPYQRCICQICCPVKVIQQMQSFTEL
jgi:hypothetical protein